MNTKSVVTLGLAIVLFAQSNAAAQVTVGGNITMSITTGLPNQEPIAIVNATKTVRYKRQSSITKLTVSTSCPSQSYTLKVFASSVPQGTAAPEVTLINGMLATDFITNIPIGNTNVTATLQYTASATFAQGNSAENGDDVHTVTYTLVVQ